MSDPTSQPHDPVAVAVARELIRRLCEGQLDREGAATLEAMVRGDPAIRRLYILTVATHADLYLQASLLVAEDPTVPLQDDEPASLDDAVVARAILDCPPTDDDAEPAIRLPTAVRPPASRFAWPVVTRWAIAAAAVVVAGGAVMWAVHGRSSRTPAVVIYPTLPAVVPPAPLRMALGRLDLSMNPAWVDGATPGDRDGTVAASDELRLRSGLVRLTFNSGAAVVIEGPAEAKVESAGRIRLTGGRLTVRAPHATPGFAVDTPSAVVTDLGTEFGVSVGTEGLATSRTDAVVFGGVVRGGAGAGAPASRPGAGLMSAGQACTVTPGRVTPVEQPASLGVFVRDADFDRRKAAVDRATAMVRRADLLGYTLFDADFGRYAAERQLPRGTPWRTAAGSTDPAAEGLGVALGEPDGRWLALHGNQSAFIDLDASAAGRLAQAGLVTGDGFVGTNGHTLYLSWLARAAALPTMGYGGLSLFDGDQQAANEYLFFGQGFKATTLGCRVWKGGPSAGSGDHGTTPLDVDLTAPGIQPKDVDARPHLWVVKIEFRPGDDRTTVYLDPPPGREPAVANLAVSTADLRFNRLRLASSGRSSEWRFARVLAGTTYAAVAPP